MPPYEDLNGAGCLLGDALIVNTVLHEFAESLGAAVDAKDGHTQQHSEEVAMATHALALEMQLPEARANIIHVAAHLHDVGKIGVPDAVLLKPGPLTPKELALMRRHPVIGAQIIYPVRSLRECGVLKMVMHHHERFDGGGYPDGLRGRDIPLGARVIAVADTLSAMLQDRPYRERLPYEKVFDEIMANSGSQFDPDVVAAFSEIHEDLRDMVLGSRPPVSEGRPVCLDVTHEIRTGTYDR